MLYLTAQTQILLAIVPIDFRKQIDGLIWLCKNNLSEDPRSGKLFVFINKGHTMIRVLCYDINGYWIATKRLSKGRYAAWPKNGVNNQSLHAAELKKILNEVLQRKNK